MIACDCEAVTDGWTAGTFTGRPSRLTWFNPALLEKLNYMLPNRLVRSPELLCNRVDGGGTGTLQGDENQATRFRWVVRARRTHTPSKGKNWSIGRTWFVARTHPVTTG